MKGLSSRMEVLVAEASEQRGESPHTGQGRRQGPRLILCSLFDRRRNSSSEELSNFPEVTQLVSSITRDLNRRQSGFKEHVLNHPGYKQPAIQWESRHNYPCSKLSSGKLGAEYRMVEKQGVCVSVCVHVCACARMCREEEDRTEETPLCPGTPIFTLAASVSHSGKW